MPVGGPRWPPPTGGKTGLLYRARRKCTTPTFGFALSRARWDVGASVTYDGHREAGFESGNLAARKQRLHTEHHG